MLADPTRTRAPDEELLRRFGRVRAVGGAAYVATVAVLFVVLGWRVWPLALGVPVLAVVTTAYFLRSHERPRLAVIGSLVADALVLGGAVAFLGGTGSGLVLLYSIVLVSAGILLGPRAALAFTGFTVALGLLQLVLEQVGLRPVLLHRPQLSERLPVVLVSLVGLASVGYLSAIYAGRLHDLIAAVGAEAEALRRRGRRRRLFVRRATVDVGEPLRDVEAVAGELERRWAELDDGQRGLLASRLRAGVTRLEAEIALLADIGAMDAGGAGRPEPVSLRRAVEDCLLGLGDLLSDHVLEFDVPALKVVGDRRAIRRVVWSLLENAAEHTPAGTRVRVAAVPTAGHAVLVVADNGPGVPPEAATTLFEQPDDGARRQPAAGLGLPLVRELCEALGARVRYEPAPGGGARFLVFFRLAPSSAPGPDDEPMPGGQAAPRLGGAVGTPE